MAQIVNQPILSLCIPIYNRLKYLERQLARFVEDKDLFGDQIQLIISDNCSTDDLLSCCEKYQQQGLKLLYHRNDTNLGADGNFDWCFHHADGRYVWLLGSDDVPVKGVLTKVIECLSSNDYGLFHLSQRRMDQEIAIYNDSDEMAVSVNYWFTFMSANIIRTDSLMSVNLFDYRHSFMIQVPAYLNACCSSQRNAILFLPEFFEKETDGANNGGYNLFQVFVINLYGIYESFMDKGLLSRQAFDQMIKIEYRNFLLGFIVRQLVLRRKRNFTTDGGWKILWKYYRKKPYFYFYLLKEIGRLINRRILCYRNRYRCILKK